MTIKQARFLEALKTSSSFKEAMEKAGYSKWSSRAGVNYENLKRIVDNNNPELGAKLRKKMKLPPKISLRNKADKLLQEYIKTKYDDCLVCGNPVNCGHHFVTKASSNALRYYLPNIIPICKLCHCRVHTQPHLVEPIICFALGKDWYDDLMEVKRQGIKENLDWYRINIEILEGLLGGLKNGTMAEKS